MGFSRDSRFDILKAMAIGMVVVGHVISTQEISLFSGSRLSAAIVGLNMPLFFALSGYFAENTIGDGVKVFRRLGRYLKSMIAYAVLIAALFYGLGIWDTVGLAAKRCFTLPFYGWWYMWVLMLCLVSCWLVVWFCRRFVHSRAVSALFVLFAWVALLMLPDTWWQMRYFKFNLPFFVLGCAVRRYDVVRWVRHPYAMWVWGLACAFYAFYVIDCASFPVSFYWANFNLTHIVGSGLDMGAYFVRYLVALAGIVTVACPILRNGHGEGGVLAELGKTTMGVYFIHQVSIRHIIIPVCQGAGQLSLGRLMVISIALWLGCHLIVSSLAAHALTRKFFN